MHRRVAAAGTVLLATVLAGCTDVTAPGTRPSLTVAGYGVADLRGITRTDLGTLGAYGGVTAANDNGQVTIYFTSFSGVPKSPVIWHDGTITELPPGFFPSDINNFGTVAGTFMAEPRSAARWENGVTTVLETPGRAHAINDAGQVVGHTGENAVLWNPASRVNLGYAAAQGINNLGVIAGGTLDAAAGRFSGATWSGGSWTILPSSGVIENYNAYAEDINDLGEVVGQVNGYMPELEATRPDWPFGSRPVMWTNGILSALPLPPSEDIIVDASAIAINDLGHVIGYAGGIPCVWIDGQVIVLEGPTGQWAAAINNRGEIFGSLTEWTGSDWETRLIRWTLNFAPPTPQEELQELTTEIATIVASGTLSTQTAGALSTKVDAAMRKLDDSDSAAAANILRAFINQVEAGMRNGKIDATTGQALVTSAGRAIASIS